MKIGIVPNLRKETGGTYQYSLAFLEILPELINKSDFSFVVLTDETDHPILSKIKNSKITITRLISSNSLVYHLKELVIKILKKSGLYVYVNKIYSEIQNKKYEKNNSKIRYNSKLRQRLINHNIDLMIYTISEKLSFESGIPFIFVIHDLQHKYFPRFFTENEIKEREYCIKNGAHQSELIICESKQVKNDIVKYYRIPEKKVIILPSPPPSYIKNYRLNPQNIDIISMKYSLPGRYLFYPAQFWHHKNHINLIRALGFIKDKYHEKLPLVLVGAVKNSYEEVIREIKNLHLSDQVQNMGFIPDKDMAYLYKLSTMLVLPTLFESMSIPIWEAFQLGIPVASSNVCSLPEQLGDAGLTFNPLDPEDMGEKIYSMWKDENLRNKCIKRGKERISKLDKEKYIQYWEKIINSVVTYL